MNKTTKSHYLYFIVYEDYFKIGITSDIYERIKSLRKQLSGQINFKDSFIYKLNRTSVTTLEYSLKLKYKNNLINVGEYKTETFKKECLKDMENDVESYHKLFNFKSSKQILTEDKRSRKRVHQNKKMQLAKSELVKKSNETKPVKLNTVLEVAEILKVDVESVNNIINNKQIKAHKILKNWRIKEEDLETYINKETNL